MVLPLEKMRVLDLTRYLSGPYCTMTLGDMGADVVKVERPPGGDDTRQLSPVLDGESYCFAMVNRNKRSIGLDVSTDRGREVLFELAATADVVVENFRPGVTARLGIDYETMRERNPQLVYCSITGFGQEGPYRHRPGFDIIAQGVCGFLRMTGHPGERPAKFGVAITDLVAGMTAVQAILAAYIHRLTTGEGQYIDVSLVDAGIALTVWEAGAYFGTGELPAQTGTTHRRNAPYQAYRTSDGYVTIGANTEAMWRSLCTDVLDAPHLLSDPRFENREARVAHVSELEQEIEAITTKQPTRQWLDLMEKTALPGGPVYTYDQTVADAHVLAREMIRDVDHPRLGPIKALGPPAKLSLTPLELRRPSPSMGEHTAEILAQSGYAEDEVSALFADGIIHAEGPGSEGPGSEESGSAGPGPADPMEARR